MGSAALRQLVMMGSSRKVVALALGSQITTGLGDRMVRDNLKAMLQDEGNYLLESWTSWR